MDGSAYDLQPRMMRIADLRDNPLQAQIYPTVPAELDMLRQSIKDRGLDQPIVVNPLGVILDGHQRVTVCKELGYQEIRVIIRSFDRQEDEDIYFLQVNLQRRQMDPLTKARVIKRLAVALAKQRGNWTDITRGQEFRDYLAEQLGGGISG